MDNKTNIQLVLEQLKRYSINDIEQQTHIEPKIINDILECNFEELRFFKTKAMIKILEREYGVDLSDWIKAFDEYCNISPCNTQEHLKIKPKLKKYDQDTINRGGFKWSFVVIFIIILIIAGIVIKFPSIFGDFLNYESQKNTQINTQNNSVSLTLNDNSNNQEINKNDENIERTTKIQPSNISLDDNLENEDNMDNNQNMDNKNNNVKLDDNLEQSKEENNQQEIDENIENNQSKIAEQDIKNDENLQTKDEYEVLQKYATKEVVVIPKRLVWFDLYDVNSKKTKSFSTTKAFTISKPTLVLTGNSLLELKAGGNMIKFDDGSIRRRFYFDGDYLKIVDALNYEKIKKLEGKK